MDDVPLCPFASPKVEQAPSGLHTRTDGDHAGCHQRTCQVCGKVFASARPQALYCSSRCRQAVLLRRRHEAGRLHRHRRCPRCGQVFVARRSDGTYCSNACRQAMHRKRTAHGKDEL